LSLHDALPIYLVRDRGSYLTDELEQTPHGLEDLPMLADIGIVGPGPRRFAIVEPARQVGFRRKDGLQCFDDVRDIQSQHTLRHRFPRRAVARREIRYPSA